PLRNPAWKSSWAIALANQRHDQVSGGKDRIARPLNAASVTTPAGSTRKPRMAATTVPPMRRRSFSQVSRMSMPPDRFERARSDAQQRQYREREHQAGDR